MNTYRIAQLKVNFQPFGRTEVQARKYLCEPTDAPDIEVSVTEARLKRCMQVNSIDLDTAYYMLSGFGFYRELINFDGLMLHASALCTGGQAYLFSGQCGIGKSTHTGYWKSLLGDRCVTINDDKPAVRIIDGKVYAYGTPWSGKHDINADIKAPVGGICFISRGDENRIERLDKKKAAMRIIDQCTKGFSESQWDKLLGMVDKIVESVPVYRLFCLNDISAARLSYTTMTGEKI